jgi:hypothetical protein
MATNETKNAREFSTDGLSHENLKRRCVVSPKRRNFRQAISSGILDLIGSNPQLGIAFVHLLPGQVSQHRIEIDQISAAAEGIP